MGGLLPAVENLNIEKLPGGHVDLDAAVGLRADRYRDHAREACDRLTTHVCALSPGSSHRSMPAVVTSADPDHEPSEGA